MGVTETGADLLRHPPRKEKEGVDIASATPNTLRSAVSMLAGLLITALSCLQLATRRMPARPRSQKMSRQSIALWRRSPRWHLQHAKQVLLRPLQKETPARISRLKRYSTVTSSGRPSDTSIITVPLPNSSSQSIKFTTGSFRMKSPLGISIRRRRGPVIL